VEVHAATTVGTTMIQLGDISGRAVIEEATRLGIDHGADEWTARSMNNLGLSHIWILDLAGAREHFVKLIEFTNSRELDAWYIAGVTVLAGIDLAGGRWDDADRELSVVLGQRTCRQTEVEALMTAAVLAVRRGDPSAELRVESAIDRTRGSLDFDMVLAGALLALEAAWVGIVDISEALPLLEEARGQSALADYAWGRGMVGFWTMRTGIDPPDGVLPGPAGLELDGRMAESAEEWAQAGYAIEATICRALVPGADLDEIFSSLAAQGADGAARGLRHELQRRGVKRVPRGERRTTRANPAGLTARQAEVLSLMQAGLSNAEIAETLFISEKTAGHHVSAILAKLNVSSRLQAVALTNGKGRDRAGV
jgi:DNA-binding CsgD family transcriptional regulator